MTVTHEGTMRIGEVAERTSLSLRTLRHYDEVGLVAPSARTDGGFRLYTEADVARLLIIRRMKPLGYTLEEMRALLEVVNDLTASPENAALRSRFDVMLEEANVRREKLKRQSAMADEFVGQLERL